MEREPLGDPLAERELLRRVGTLLERGGLVALPTETVYGIAARADLPAAIDRLQRTKGRPQDMALTWHVGSAGALERFPRLSPLARRLAARYWPGPLTLVLPGVPPGLERVARDGWTGVRAPVHAFTSELLSAVPFPVVLSSANRHGEPPAADADVVEARLAGQIELIVDGGPCRLAEASCVLRLGRGRFDLLREGLFTLEQLRATAGLSIAFVCTGNTCRSPMAEAYARHMLAERLEVPEQRLSEMGFSVASMGVFAPVGEPASRLSLEVMREAGLDLSRHRSRPAIPEEIARQDRVYCMTRAHREALVALLPPGKAAHVELLAPDGTDIPDPMGGAKADYQRAAERISAALRARVGDWA